MDPSASVMLRAARYLAVGSSALILVGIAPSQILLGLALIALLMSGETLRLPPIKLPLGLFLAGTLLAIAFSENPAAGLPQVKKIYVFCQLLVGFSVLRDLAIIRWLFLSWAALGSLSALYAIVQFGVKVRQAQLLGADFYSYYVGERITGFMSHWYTFSAQEMFVILMLASFLTFGPRGGRRTWLFLLCGLMAAIGLVLAQTRGVWIATAGAAVYLLWAWRSRLLVLDRQSTRL